MNKTICKYLFLTMTVLKLTMGYYDVVINDQLYTHVYIDDLGDVVADCMEQEEKEKGK